VQYTSDYWLTYQRAASAAAATGVVAMPTSVVAVPTTVERLQTECDMVLLRAVNSILAAQRSAVSQVKAVLHNNSCLCCSRWLGSRVVSVLDSGAERPGFKSQSLLPAGLPVHLTPLFLRLRFGFADHCALL